MATYKCPNCAHEVVSEERPSTCHSCDCTNFFVSYVDYESLLARQSKIEVDLKSLTSKNSKLQKERKDLEDKKKQLETRFEKKESKKSSERKIFLSFMIIITFIVIAGFEYLLSSAKKEKESLQAKISQIELGNNSFQEKVSQLLNENNSLQSQIDLLNKSRINLIKYYGNITAVNNSANPIRHVLEIEASSKVSVYLYGLTQDADFSIVNSDNQELAKSMRTSSNKYAEILGEYSIESPGRYYVKVWLHRGNASPYILKIYSFKASMRRD